MAAKTRARVTVDLPAPVQKVVEQLAWEHAMRPTEVIRDAVKFLIHLKDLEAEGFITGGWKTNPDGSREVVRIIVGI